MIRHSLHTALVLLSGLAPAMAQTAPAAFDETPVATVDGAPIAFSEVARSFATEPLAEPGMTAFEAHHLQRERVIGDKLLALDARVQGLDAHAETARLLRFLEDKEVIRELYRRRVLAAIDVTEEDFARAYELSRRRVRLHWVRTPDSTRAAAYAAVLPETGLDALTTSSADTKGTTDWLSFGDVAPELEAVAFTLTEGETTPPVQMDGAWMVVQLAEGERELFASEWELAERKSTLQQTLTERRAAPLAAAFVAKTMAEANVKLDREGFAALGRALTDWLDDPAHADATHAELPIVAERLDAGQTVVIYTGGAMTAADVLLEMSFLPQSPLKPGRPLAEQLRNAIGVLVRNRFLAARGRAEGLDAVPAVRRETRLAQDALLADRWRAAQRSALAIPDTEIAAFRTGDAYAALKPSSGTLSDDQIREVLAMHVLAQLEAATLSDLARRYPVTRDDDALRARLHAPDAVLGRVPAPLLLKEIFQ